MTDHPLLAALLICWGGWTIFLGLRAQWRALVRSVNGEPVAPPNGFEIGKPACPVPTIETKTGELLRAVANPDWTIKVWEPMGRPAVTKQSETSFPHPPA